MSGVGDAHLENAWPELRRVAVPTGDVPLEPVYKPRLVELYRGLIVVRCRMDGLDTGGSSTALLLDLESGRASGPTPGDSLQLGVDRRLKRLQHIELGDERGRRYRPGRWAGSGDIAEFQFEVDDQTFEAHLGLYIEGQEIPLTPVMSVPWALSRQERDRDAPYGMAPAAGVVTDLGRTVAFEMYDTRCVLRIASTTLGSPRGALGRAARDLKLTDDVGTNYASGARGGCNQFKFLEFLPGAPTDACSAVLAGPGGSIAIDLPFKRSAGGSMPSTLPRWR